MIITVLTLKMMYKCVVNIHEGQGEDYLDKISWSAVLFTEVNFVKIFNKYGVRGMYESPQINVRC